MPSPRSCAHDRIICGGGRASVEEPEFYWVNTVLGNLKSAAQYIPRGGGQTCATLPRRFQYRFNRRADLSALIPRLAFVALRTPAMPYRLLKMAYEEW